MHVISRRCPIATTIATAMLMLAVLSGCATHTADATPPAGESTASASSWPRVVDVDGQKITIKAQPRKIVAITSETADLALQLAGPSRLAAIPASSQLPVMGTAVELARQVPNTLPTGTDPDPEKVLSYGPDLVVSTLRHDGEKNASRQIQASGVPVVSLSDSDFTTPEKLAHVIDILGQVLGEQDRAAQLSTELMDSVKSVDADRGTAHPTALSLMARGNTVMAFDDSQMLPGLVRRAGATNAGASVGLTQTRPVDAELVAKANPQVIFLEDFMGQGRKPFAALLASPVLASVPAIANAHVYLIPMTQASAVSGTQTAVGYRAIVDDLKKVS
ncbi:iron complex transport system substrate-binding protein [Propionibacterium cyclohexanicum]|uniref:Iron complex transport system substrate-binding protein n=1 Tax=Propionibacterium cyclohexanicum TaxID=64702 RepID=A0A1H9RZV2_9ACTN|nr:ABC transporter substrate-binding protein [Propionibacterium cyclohexanicum]SER77633.1 iron complex transport system substrate-binding protein [Propionibacterium cyclohexanicum]